MDKNEMLELLAQNVKNTQVGTPEHEKAVDAYIRLLHEVQEEEKLRSEEIRNAQNLESNEKIAKKQNIFNVIVGAVNLIGTTAMLGLGIVAQQNGGLFAGERKATDVAVAKLANPMK